eukprot:15459145-Alexandrium_andersonii.AAC.1
MRRSSGPNPYHQTPSLSGAGVEVLCAVRHMRRGPQSWLTSSINACHGERSHQRCSPDEALPPDSPSLDLPLKSVDAARA